VRTERAKAEVGELSPSEAPAFSVLPPHIFSLLANGSKIRAVQSPNTGHDCELHFLETLCFSADNNNDPVMIIRERPLMSYLRDIAVFVKVVERKGFAAAGRELGLSAPSVSKQIARLEAELGVVLIHRTTHSLSLTDAGRELYEHSVKGLAELETARTAAIGYNDKLSGTLRVHATLSVGQGLIGPALIAFMVENPEIRIRLELGPVPVNPIERQFDLAVRTKPRKEKSPGNVSIGRRILGDVYQTVIASPKYLARHGHPACIEELRERHCLVHVTQSTDETWTFAMPNSDVSVRIDPMLRSNNWLCIRDAALEGLGVARLPDFAVREELAAGRLVALFEEFRRSDQQVQAFFPLTQRMPARLRLLLEFLAARIGTPHAAAPSVTEADSTPSAHAGKTKRPGGTRSSAL
jgi:DNA-binding transcriptional LysR family regulator